VTEKMILKDVLLAPLPKLKIMDMEAITGGEDRYAVVVEQDLIRIFRIFCVMAIKRNSICSNSVIV